MKRTNPFWKLVFLALALTLCFVLAILLIIYLRLSPQQASFLEEILYQNIYYILAIITIVPVSFWVIFEICYTRFYLPLKKIPTETSVIFKSNPSHRIELKGNQDIQDLLLSINEFADIYENINIHIAEEIGAARNETERERNLLASIMAELPVGLIICNITGRILLFNSHAKIQFTSPKLKQRTEYFLGLGRSIFHIIDQSLITHALEEIEERLNRGKKRVASYFIAQIDKDLPILVETIPVLDQDKLITGFILSLQDISGAIQRFEAINEGVSFFSQALNRHIADIDSFLLDPETLAAGQQKSISEKLKVLKKEYNSAAETIMDSAFEPIPLTKLDLEHLLFLVQKSAGYEKNIRLNITITCRGKRILGDTHSFIAALVFLFERLSNLTSQDEFGLQATMQENEVNFDISWGNNPVNCAEIEKIMTEKVPSLTYLSYIFKQNKATLHTYPAEDDNCLQLRITARAELAIPFPGKRRSPVIAGSRPEYYDFNLFKTDGEAQDLLDCDLKSLTYSIIDTETTGLDPAGGDEIISIGAVRIVKNRIVHEDCFEQLVNPEREIPFESFKIHGIDAAMVDDQPTIEAVLPDFKRYISETVILGHDVAFDMKMLGMKEKATGITFSNPVLDTLLLSAMLHPIHKQHDIESIAKRLGVDIIGRHTALGDAVAAAEIFIKLIPILQSKGINTLKEAIEASKRTYFLRLRY